MKLEVRTNHLEVRHMHLQRHENRSSEAEDKEEPEGASQEMLDKLHDRVHLKFPISSRSFVLTALDFFGCSLEYVCARILFLHYLHEADKEVSEVVGSPAARSTKDHLRKALEYIDYHLQCVQEDANFVFGRTQALFLQMQLLRALEDGTGEVHAEAIKGIASTCLQLATKHNYIYIRQMVKAFLLSCAHTNAYSDLLQEINAENEEVPLSQSELDRLWRE